MSIYLSDGNRRLKKLAGRLNTIDNTLDPASENPVQNKTLYNPVTFAESERQKTVNLLKITRSISSETASGVTITTDLENQTITLNGTPTGYVEKGITISNLILKANKKYSVVAKIVSGSVSYTSGTDFYINLNYVATWSNYFKDLPKGVTFNTDTEIFRILLSYNNNATFNNLVFQLQIQEGEPSDWQYPYGAIVHEEQLQQGLETKVLMAGIQEYSINLENLSFNTLTDMYNYMLENPNKLFECGIGEHASNSVKTLLGNPSGFANYTSLKIVKVCNSWAGEKDKRGTIYKCYAIADIVNKLAEGYIFCGGNGANEPTFTGWKTLY